MAPRPSGPRLRDLDPARFARGVQRATCHHLTMRAFDLGIEIPPIGERSSLWLSAHQLALYALTGRGTEDAGGPMEYVQSVAEALYTRAGDAGTYDVPDLDEDADPRTWPGLVIRAALARERVMRGIEMISRADLAVLGSLDERQVRRLIDEGEIVGDNRAGVHPDHARQWLAVRGVEGFARSQGGAR